MEIQAKTFVMHKRANDCALKLKCFIEKSVEKNFILPLAPRYDGNSEQSFSDSETFCAANFERSHYFLIVQLFATIKT